MKVLDSKVSWHEGGRETFEKLKIEEGDFHQAVILMREATGIQNYNIKLTIINEEEEDHIIFGIVSVDGESLYFLNDTDNTSVNNHKRITEEEARALGQNN